MRKHVGTHKTCKICNQTKENSLCIDDEFMCKSCKSEQNKAYRLANFDKLKAYQREYSKKKSVEWKVSELPRVCKDCGNTKPTKDFPVLSNSCNECTRKWQEDYDEKRRNCPERLEWKRQYAIKDAPRQKAYSLANKERKRIYRKKYNLQNKEKINSYLRNKRNSDPQYRIKKNVSCRLRNVLRANKSIKKQRTTDLLGCSIPELQSYLASFFKDGMTWDNYWKGIWEIDHVIPTEFFDLTDETQQKICFHHSNLRPLWADENNQKADYYLGIRWRDVPDSVKNLGKLTEMIEEVYNI